MRIYHNIPALYAYNALNNTNSALQKSIRTLSTGLRINSAADDAAGLAISEKMRAQINGLNMALRNAQDGISMLQTAEGALADILVVAGNPVEDIRLLEDPHRNFAVIMKDGRIYKGEVAK